MQTQLSFALAAGLGLTIVTGASAQGKNPPGVNPQHYECYDVVKATSTLENKVQLRDQFGPSETVTARPLYLCNPVSKNKDDIRDRLTHLVCYEIRRVRFAQKQVAIVNQFGVDTLAVGPPRTLCVPSLKQVLR